MVSLSTGSGKLAFSMKTLRTHWDRTQSEWSDRVRDDFETNYLTPIETEVMGTMNAMSNLSQVLAKAMQECE